MSGKNAFFLSVLCFPCLQAILEANARGHKLIIMDARPKINALANQVSSVKNVQLAGCLVWVSCEEPC